MCLDFVWLLSRIKLCLEWLTHPPFICRFCYPFFFFFVRGCENAISLIYIAYNIPDYFYGRGGEISAICI